MNNNNQYNAAKTALDYVKSGMLLGLGSGSTANIFIDLLGQKLRSGELTQISGVPTSLATQARAESAGIPLVSLDKLVCQNKKLLIDLAVDGADEVDPKLNLIKGLGRALLREKIVEIHAEHFLVIVTDDKLVARLGTRGPLPVEIARFEALATVSWMNTLGCRAELWMEQDGAPAVSDNGNYFALLKFENGIEEPALLAEQLEKRPGVIEHGLFLKMANRAIVAGEFGIKMIEHDPRF